MTRINTNVSSLTAQNSLARSNAELNTALTRLSTGLRINSGADDPAGLIASEALASDITATTKAISNSERANEMIATADSALSQVSDLLNDIRGLVTEAANTGAMSSDQIAANQLQVDSSLEAINRIAQTTTFQGKRLLDGSLDFTTTTWTGDSAKVTGLKIKQANLGTSGSLAVAVNVTTAATKAQIGAATGSAGVAATATVEYVGAGSVASTLTVTAPGTGTGYNGVSVKIEESSSVAADAPTAVYDSESKVLTVTVSSNAATTTSAITSAISSQTGFTATAGVGATSYDPSLNIPAGQQATGSISFSDGTTIGLTAGTLIGTDGNGVLVHFVENGATPAGTPTASYNSGTNTLTVTVNDATATTAADIADAITADGSFIANVSAGTGGYDPTIDNATDVAGVKASVNHVIGGATLTFTAKATGTAANAQVITILADGTGGAGTVDLTGSTATSLVIHLSNGVGDTTDLTAIQNALTASGVSLYDVTFTGGTTVDNATAAASSPVTNPPTVLGVNELHGVDTSTSGGYDVTSATMSGGTGSGALAGDIVFELTGSKGTQVFSFDTGTTAAQIISAINAASDATGVSASATGSNVTFNSSGYGSEALINIKMISDAEGSFSASLTATRDYGADITGTINGVTATGSGTTLSVNSGTLSMNISMNGATSADGDSTSFVIDGGGALFQLGADVTTGQQARIGIQSINSSSLGGVDGLLYTLGSGEENALDTDPTTAALIVDEVITEVTSLRGRLGAFQKATLQSNIAALTDAQENLTSAQSNIRDTDFAAESANLTRAQILVQSGTSVLSIANQNPQNVLSLLR